MHLLRSSLAAALLLCISSHALATSYSITDFGIVTRDMWPGDLNFNGQLVGPSIQTNTAIIKQGNTITNLSTLGGSSSYAHHISDSGQVVGYSYTAGNSIGHAFLWSNGSMQDLGAPGGGFSSAFSINDVGQVVGDFDTKGTTNTGTRSFLWSNGVMQDLGVPGASTARAINNAGQIAGVYTVNNTDFHPYIWSNGVMQDLGTLGGSSSAVHAINNAGQVVGQSSTTGTTYHAFLWSNGVMQDLGTLGGAMSYALDINDAGQVVGQTTSVGYQPRPFLWSNGEMRDLNTLIDDPTWLLYQVKHIDDLGRIVGFGDHNGVTSAFMLTPEDATPAVPEPGTVVLLGAGLLGLAVYPRFRK